MFPGTSDLLALTSAFAVPLLLVILATPGYMNFLRRRNRLATDVHKTQPTKVPTPAGPLLALALVVGEVVDYAFYRSLLSLVVIGVIAIAAAIGLFDDFRGLGGWAKPALLLLAGLPLIVGQRVDPDLYSAMLYFPLFTNTGTHFIIFATLILISIPVVSNAFNMLDAFNGEISGFTLITVGALVVAIVLRAVVIDNSSVERIAVALPLAGVALAFYFFNRYPSKIFDGDSGSLTFGAMYAALAILGDVEIAALVALIPAILNSYYILSSVRGFVEHKRMASRPTYLGEDGKLHPSTQPGAPRTLARMILLGGPMGERELVRSIMILTLFAAALSVITSVMTWLL